MTQGRIDGWTDWDRESLAGSGLHRHGFIRRGVWEPCGDDRP